MLCVQDGKLSIAHEDNESMVGIPHVRCSSYTEGDMGQSDRYGSRSPHDFLSPGEEAVVTSTAYTIGPRSIVVLLEI